VIGRFAAKRARAKPARSWSVGDCSLPCGASMLRVLASHQFASA
jgi:murein endopeptidase